MPTINPNILNDPIGGMHAQFGVPTCMLDLTKEVLNLLPGDILGGLYEGIGQGMMKARGVIANITRDLFRSIGIIEYDTATGKFMFISDSAKWGQDGFLSGLFGSVGNFIGQVAGFGAELWRNYQVVSEQIQAIEDCLDDFHSWLDGPASKGTVKSSAELAATLGRVDIYKAQIKTCTDFLDKATAFQTRIEEVLRDRQLDPSLIPVFIDEEDEAVVDPLFRLTFGPPSAKSGQFLLSVDGLYYNSQTREYGTSGHTTDVPTVIDISALEFVPDSDRWLLDHSPNLGGRGKSYSLGELDRYVNTIFDINKIDESKELKVYYEADHTVQFIMSQKNKRVDDIHGNLKDLLASGYSQDSAIYLNYEQQIISEGASFNNKINKRKKQIEVAVKTPDLFGISSLFMPGTIPINDFSYLSSINLDVEIDRQKNLVFDHGEVSGVVLPVLPKYVHAPDSKQKVVLTPLLVAEPGAGSVVDGEELETQAPTLSLVTGIETEGMIAVYNFTDTNFQKPASTVFDTLNCNALGIENRAQLVTNNPPTLFPKGLSIPYLQGTVIREKHNSDYGNLGQTFSSYPFAIKDAGNFARLPDTEEYRNLMYNKDGATIDFWTYIPGLYQEEDGWWEHPYNTSSMEFNLSSSTGKWCNGHYYRVLLGCENTGGENTGLASSAIELDYNSDSVRGMLMGFSRDPRMYYEGSAILQGPNDFDPRANYGGIVDSVNSLNATNAGIDGVGNAYWDGANASAGVWTVSGDDTNDIPIAAFQASGTFSVNQNTGKITFKVGSASSQGDAYQGSSNDACCVLYTKGDDDSEASSIVSSVINIPYFDTGTNKQLQIGTPSTVFFIAPTRSYNTSAVGFANSLNCDNDPGEILRFTVSDQLLVSGMQLSNCAKNFINISVVFDVPTDKLKFYINGVLMKEGLISTLFQKNKRDAPQVPSFMVPSNLSTSSFEYTSGTVTQNEGMSLFNDGPLNNKFFTPWIVGGGWTDGRDIDLATSSGGFLDTGAGIMSSYNGYVGSLKFYQKALNKDEVIKNYNHQKTFFENMDT